MRDVPRNLLWDESKSDYLTDKDILMSNALSNFDNEANMNLYYLSAGYMIWLRKGGDELIAMSNNTYIQKYGNSFANLLEKSYVYDNSSANVLSNFCNDSGSVFYYVIP